MKRVLPILVVLAALAGCGGSHHPTKAPVPSCNVPIGKGAPGTCAPPSFKEGAKKVPKQLGRGQVTFPDLSNNDPVYNMAPIARAGHPAVWLKVNEGTGFIDRTFEPMVRAARKARLAPGGYDFVRNYNAAEANLFVSRLKATGTCTGSKLLPPTLDIEVGNATRRGVQTMVDVVRRACGRVAIYTGLWYWNPHLGSWWPRGVYAWISGYPTIVGSASYSQVHVHQFTDRGFNGVFNADLNLWKGSGSFNTFINNATKPKPRPNPVPAWAGKGHRYPFHSSHGWYRVVVKYKHHRKIRFHYYGPHDAPKVRVR